MRVLNVFCTSSPFQIGFICAIEARIVDLLAIREGGKRLKPHINTCDIFGWSKRRRNRFAGKARKPLAGTFARECDRLRCALNGSMQHLHELDEGMPEMPDQREY